MKWNEIKELYPDQWVKLKVLESHKDGDYLCIDEMEIITPIGSDKEATLELTKSTGDNLVFHTSHDIIRTKLIESLGLLKRSADNITLDDISIPDVPIYIGSVSKSINALLGLDVLLNAGAIIDLKKMEIRFE